MPEMKRDIESAMLLAPIVAVAFVVICVGAAILLDCIMYWNQ